MFELANVMKAGECKHQTYFYSMTNHFAIEIIKYMKRYYIIYTQTLLQRWLIMSWYDEKEGD